MASLSFLSSQVWYRSKAAKEAMHDFGSHDSIERYPLFTSTAYSARCYLWTSFCSLQIQSLTQTQSYAFQGYRPATFACCDPFLYLPTMVMR